MPPISSIQVLRALAALMVVVHHVQPDAALLARGLSAAQVERLSQAQHKGWVLGSASFLGAMAQRTERPLAPRPRGRPPTPTATR